jgi:7 transmembrane receptor (rhodopsin family)
MPSDLFFLISFSVAIIASLVGLVFGAITILIVILHRPSRTINNLLTCNTCAAVVFYAIVVITSSVYGYRLEWTLNAPHCTLRAYLFNVTIAAICHSKAVHALSRLFSAVFYKYQFLSTWRTHYLMIVGNWILCCLICLLPFFIEHGFGLELESRSCVVTSKMTLLALYTSMTSCILPFNVIIMVYGMIFFHVHRSTRRIRALRTDPVNTQQSLAGKNTREIKLMKTMLIQMSILLFGGPVFLFLIIWHAVESKPAPEFLYLLGFNAMTMVGSIVIVVQLLMDDKLKQVAKQALLRCVRVILQKLQVG